MFLSTAILLAVTIASPVWAQATVARCAAGFDWNKNTFGQDPCTVGAILDASCRGLTEYTYPPLTKDAQDYLPPKADHFGDAMCDCNTVMYSLYMACASCQRGQIYSWKQWIPECASVHVSHYPENIPSGTTIPRWAYFDITTLPNQTWNDSVAMNTGQDPQNLLKRIARVPDIPKDPESQGRTSVIKIPPGFPTATTPTPDPNVEQPTNTVANAISPDPVNPPDNTDSPRPTKPSNDANIPGPMSPPDNTDVPRPTNPPANNNVAGPTNPPDNVNLPGSVSPSDNTNLPGPTTPAGNADTPGPATPTSDNNSPGPATPASDSNSSGPANPSSNTNRPGSKTPTTSSKTHPPVPSGNNNNSQGSTNAGNTNGRMDVWAIVVVLFIWTLV